MQDAKRLRAQAERCLQIAELMSDGEVEPSCARRRPTIWCGPLSWDHQSKPDPQSRFKGRRDRNGAVLFSGRVRWHHLRRRPGEDFPTVADAMAHAKVVAAELGRNNPKAVTVFLVTDDGAQIASVPAGPVPPGP